MLHRGVCVLFVAGAVYLGDGAVLLGGHHLVPDDAALASLRTVWPTPAEHARYPTLYPPGALALFALAAGAGPAWAPVVWKLLVLTASLATLFVGAVLLGRHGRERHLPLLARWRSGTMVVGARESPQTDRD